MSTPNTYDVLPNRSLSIEWTAPKQLVLASLLHNGPRQSPDTYTVLDLGRGDGASPISMANYQRYVTFMGMDRAFKQINIANTGKSELELSNIEFIHADFLTLAHLANTRYCKHA